MVCFSYDPDSVKSQEIELKVLHYETDQWVDVTVQPVDTANNEICASVSSFSPFVIVEPPCCELRGDIDHNGRLDGLDITYFVDWLWKFGLPPECEDEVDVNGDGFIDPYGS